LIEFKFEGTSFNTFPTDFNSLQCLKYFKTHSSNDLIDLSKIDLSKMPCLEFVQFHSWRDNLSGVPKGINQVKTVKVTHTNLTDEEKIKLKKGL